VLLLPSHVSAVHTLPSSVQAVPFGSLTSVGQACPATPVHDSARSHSPAADRQEVPAGVTTSAGQITLVPSQTSPGSHRSEDPARQTKVLGCTPSAGQVALLPVHVSAASQASVAARQTAPALPTGCWQSTLVPLQVSLVQGLPSLVHAVPLVRLPSAGQVCPAVPVQLSATSHSPAEARHTVPPGVTTSTGQLLFVPSQLSGASHESPDPARHTNVLGWTPSGGQVVLIPVQVSATSHAPLATRQTAPELPTACWQVTLLPLQVSVVHGLPSSAQTAPLVLRTQVAEQHEPAVPLEAPSSHCSGASIRPFPQVTYVTVILTESTDAVRLPPDACCAESAAPKVMALMSEADHVSDHRSADPP